MIRRVPGLSVWCVATAVAAFGVAWPGQASADIYQCQAADGSIHFTNVRPNRSGCRLVVRERKNAGRNAKSRGPTLPPRRATDASPDRFFRYDPILREAARLYQLPEPFLRAVVSVESDFNPQVVSVDGAMGLMQLMPRTAMAMGVRDPFDPRENIFGGARFLRVLANKFNGDLVLTIAAYNAGDGAVLRYQGIPPYAETRRYVQRVLERYYRFRQAGS